MVADMASAITDAFEKDLGTLSKYDRQSRISHRGSCELRAG